MPTSPFAVRDVFALTTALGIYFSLAHIYGFGRAILCFATLCLGASSSLFFVAVYHSLKDEQPRNGVACALLGMLILAGALLIAFIVFQVPPSPVLEFRP